MAQMPQDMDAQATLFTRREFLWSVSGALNFHSVPQLLPEIEERMSTAPDNLQVDLHSVRHSDSSAMALLVEWVYIARRHGVTIQFTNPPEQLRKLAHITGLSDLLGMAD